MADDELNVLIVTHWLSRRAGGLFWSVRRLAQSLVDAGTETRVYGLWDEDTERDAASWLPLLPHAGRATGPRSLGYSQSVFSGLARDAQAPGALIHLHGLWKLTSLASLHASRRYRAPRIVSPRGMLDKWALDRSQGRKRLAALLYENANLRGADCIHVLCDAEADQVRAFGLRNPIAVIPNGVDLPGPDAACGDPAPPGWSDRKVMLFLSRLHPKKGIPALVRAWARAGVGDRGWALAIAGPDEDGHRAMVEGLVAELRVSSSVRIVGPQYGDGKHAWFRRASAFVLPSHSEGFPVAVLEAMAYGLPVLISPACNFPGAVAGGAAVESKAAPEELAERLAEVAGMSAEERTNMGEAGRALVARDYQWRTIAERMVGVYRWLRYGGARPDCVVVC